MDLLDMRLKAVIEWFEARMNRNASEGLGWFNPTTMETFAEIKRRCGIITEQCAACATMKADEHLAAIIGRDIRVHYAPGPAPGCCPGPLDPTHRLTEGLVGCWTPTCPVVGEGADELRQALGLVPCPKCSGNSYLPFHPTASDTHPCPRCLAAKPAAPTGYEHVEEWRVPVVEKEQWLAPEGKVAGPWSVSTVRDLDNIDGGKRWILRKAMEFFPCLKCGRMGIGPKEKFPCGNCLNERNAHSAPEGYEYTHEWEPPNGRIYLGFVGDEPTAFSLPTDEPQWILRKKPEEVLHICMKCGQGWKLPSVGKPRPCTKCFEARPTLQPGYKYTEEWRLVENWEQYLSARTGKAMTKFMTSAEGWPLRTIDGGRRWILEKIEECDCPTVRGIKLHWYGCTTIDDLTRRVEELEKKA